MTRYMGTTAAAVAALAMSTAAGLSQEATTFDFWNDHNLAGDETAYSDFNTAFTDYGLFETWDTDRDEFLSQDELARGVYGLYDVDQDQMLGEEEIVGMGEERLLGGMELGQQGEALGFTDFQARVGDQPVYVGWDTDEDGVISRDEFTRGIFVSYDVNQDDVLDADEITAARESRIFTY